MGGSARLAVGKIRAEGKPAGEVVKVKENRNVDGSSVSKFVKVVEVVKVKENRNVDVEGAEGQLKEENNATESRTQNQERSGAKKSNGNQDRVRGGGGDSLPNVIKDGSLADAALFNL